MEKSNLNFIYADKLENPILNHCIKSAIELEKICQSVVNTDEYLLGIEFAEVGFLWLIQPTNRDALEINICSIIDFSNRSLSNQHKLYLFDYNDGYLGIPCVDDAHFIEQLNWIVSEKMIKETMKAKEENKNG